MGTGASSASSRSPSPEFAQSQPNSRRNTDTDENQKNVLTTMEREKWRGQNIICNDVAPIIISKDCFEEYQCPFLIEKPTAVLGAIKEGMPEHSLIQVRLIPGLYYFDYFQKCNGFSYVCVCHLSQVRNSFNNRYQNA